MQTAQQRRGARRPGSAQPARRSVEQPSGPAGTQPSAHADARVRSEISTRQRVLRLVVEDGPVSVVDLAQDLDLTSAGVRRHVAALQDAGQIAVHDAGAGARPVRRGRPARRYVATDRGQAALSNGYSDLAAQAMEYLAAVGGDQAVAAFASRHAAALEDRHRDAVSAAGSDLADRVAALADGLAADGYAASARPVPGGRALQLCQGHCPVQDVAVQFPQLCEAESKVFSELLGVHVQRLSTLAAGGHVCTTHVPVDTVLARPPDPPPETSTSTLSRPTDRPGPVRAASDRPAAAETVEGTR